MEGRAERRAERREGHKGEGSKEERAAQRGGREGGGGAPRFSIAIVIEDGLSLLLSCVP
jgi:hypothetical protein